MRAAAVVPPVTESPTASPGRSTVKIRTHHNGDDVYIAWKTDGPIDDCRGFALRRRRNGVNEVVSTWVGFRGDRHAPGERRPSTTWPIQRYQWTDYMAEPGDRLQYQVVPMVGPKGALVAAEALASEWTPEITLNSEVAPGFHAYFNRGVVAAQWVSRRLGITADDLKPTEGADRAGAALLHAVETPGNPLRDFLAGGLGARLFELLTEASDKNLEVYAALYEFEDTQLERALLKLGKRAHVVLANGSWQQRPKTAAEKAEEKRTGVKIVLPRGDQNREVRKRLKKIDLHDRILRQGTLGHNKFLVICDEAGTPRSVWTGSTNWTKTGLCTQANNALLIEDPRIAAEYFEQWKRLRDADGETPASLKTENSTATTLTIGDAATTLWFTPTIKEVDLAQARALIERAKDAVLFLMFNPGPSETTLLGSIVQTAMARPRSKPLFVRGALNQDPSSSKTPVVLFDQKTQLPADLRVTLPAAIDAPTEWFVRELKKLPQGIAMVHSKVVIVDPFGAHPVVMTGSHNLGPKASKTNDENLLLIEGSPGLAGAYATNVMSVFDQYNWRYNNVYKVQGAKSFSGLRDNEYWQPWHWTSDELAQRRAAKLSEMSFWVGDPR